MADRDLDITKFSYKSYRRLKKTLGEFDAVVECNEIAIREFIKNAEEKGSEKYIKQLSSDHDVRVDAVDFSKFSSRIRSYYLASVCQQLEQFLKDFRSEWKEFFPEREWLNRKEGETALANALRTLEGLPVDLLSPNLIKVYNYYRLVRNYVEHTDRDIKALTDLIDEIEKGNEIKGDLKNLHILKVSNRIESINFDDFLILTKIVKHIAFSICFHAKPENNKIAEMLFRESKNKHSICLKKLKNNEERYDKALKRFITTTYGRFSSKDIKEVLDKLKSLLA